MSELRDPKLAQDYLLQSFLLSTSGAPDVARLTAALGWALELVSDGHSIPLLGFVADLGHFANRTPAVENAEKASSVVEHRVDSSLVRRYEDYVLGKLYADLSVERGIDGLQKYKQRDRDKAIAYLINQVVQRTQLSGVLISPAVAKGLLSMKPERLSEELQRSQAADLDQGLVQEFEALIQCVRNAGELLGAEDIFELERGTALSQYGQRIALRQLLQATEFLAIALPKQKPRGAGRQYSVSTNILQEDFYPVGGFSSISNRGTIESLLRSELAYIDDDRRPDLFDIKYVRDELLYYSRDENQFFRRRMCFMFVLDADLTSARVKDPNANWQRIIYALAIIVVAVRALSEWLSNDALRFEIIFREDSKSEFLTDERTLLETIFHDEMQAGLVRIDKLSSQLTLERCQSNARECLCHCTILHATQKSAFVQQVAFSGSDEQSRMLPLIALLSLVDSQPLVKFDDVVAPAENEADAWRTALKCLFDAWL